MRSSVQPELIDADAALPRATLGVERGADGVLRMELGGRLEVDSANQVWRRALDAAGADAGKRLVVDASGLEACDGAGLALLFELRRHQRARGAAFDVEGLADGPAALFEELAGHVSEARVQEAPAPGLFESVGRGVVRTCVDVGRLARFAGSLARSLGSALLQPRRVRWRDVWRNVETIGVNALPIVVVINLMVGLIMAFEAGQALRAFGAEIFAADLVALAVLRELGPLMTAVVLTGRTGSAFAAELGTMKVGEEVSALDTMAIEPLRFLAVPRVLAAVLTTPILTLFGNAFALLGGAVVFVLLDFPPITFVNQVRAAADVGDLTIGLVKAAVFGVLIAAVGCLRGLETGTDAAAVGRSTTRAMVSGLFLVIIVDALFSVVLSLLDL